MRRAPLVPAVLLVSVVVTGCSSTSGTTAASSAPAGTPSASSASARPAPSAAQSLDASPVAALVKAGETTGKAGSMRFALSTAVDAGVMTTTVKASGVVDNAKRLADMTFDVTTGQGQPVRIEQRIVGDALYMALPQEPGTFYKLSVEDLTGTSLAESTDPTAGFAALRAASDDVTEVGTETVRGTRTRHFRGTYDLKAALAQAEGAAKQPLRATIKVAATSTVPFDAYVDDEGRVRKMVQKLDVKVPGAGAQKARTTTTVEAYDFGVAVKVTAPPKSQVKDGAPLVKALKAQAAGNG